MDDLDRRLAALDRAPRIAPALLDDLATRARREARLSRRRRLGVAGAIAIVTAAGGLVAAPAAADAAREFLAQATWFQASGTEVTPNSEWVDLTASDLDAYIESVYREDFPVPPGMTREEVIARTQQAWAGSDGVSQAIGFHHSFELITYCGWTIELVNADDAGDEARYDAALAVLVSATEWPAIVATDGGGVREWMTMLTDRAAVHDESVKYDMFTSGECANLGFSLSDIE